MAIRPPISRTEIMRRVREFRERQRQVEQYVREQRSRNLPTTSVPSEPSSPSEPSQPPTEPSSTNLNPLEEAQEEYMSRMPTAPGITPPKFQKYIQRRGLTRVQQRQYQEKMKKYEKRYKQYERQYGKYSKEFEQWRSETQEKEVVLGGNLPYDLRRDEVIKQMKAVQSGNIPEGMIIDYTQEELNKYFPPTGETTYTAYDWIKVQDGDYYFKTMPDGRRIKVDNPADADIGFRKEGDYFFTLYVVPKVFAEAFKKEPSYMREKIYGEWNKQTFEENRQNQQRYEEITEELKNYHTTEEIENYMTELRNMGMSPTTIETLKKEVIEYNKALEENRKRATTAYLPGTSIPFDISTIGGKKLYDFYTKNVFTKYSIDEVLKNLNFEANSLFTKQIKDLYNDLSVTKDKNERKNIINKINKIITQKVYLDVEKEINNVKDTDYNSKWYWLNKLYGGRYVEKSYNYYVTHSIFPQYSLLTKVGKGVTKNIPSLGFLNKYLPGTSQPYSQDFLSRVLEKEKSYTKKYKNKSADEIKALAVIDVLWDDYKTGLKDYGGETAWNTWYSSLNPLEQYFRSFASAGLKFTVATATFPEFLSEEVGGRLYNALTKGKLEPVDIPGGRQTFEKFLSGIGGVPGHIESTTTGFIGATTGSKEYQEQYVQQVKKQQKYPVQAIFATAGEIAGLKVMAGPQVKASSAVTSSGIKNIYALGKKGLSKTYDVSSRFYSLPSHKFGIISKFGSRLKRTTVLSNLEKYTRGYKFGTELPLKSRVAKSFDIAKGKTFTTGRLLKKSQIAKADYSKYFRTEKFSGLGKRIMMSPKEIKAFKSRIGKSAEYYTRLEPKGGLITAKQFITGEQLTRPRGKLWTKRIKSRYTSIEATSKYDFRKYTSEKYQLTPPAGKGKLLIEPGKETKFIQNIIPEREGIGPMYRVGENKLSRMLLETEVKPQNLGYQYMERPFGIKGHFGPEIYMSKVKQSLPSFIEYEYTRVGQTPRTGLIRMEKLFYAPETYAKRISSLRPRTTNRIRTRLQGEMKPIQQPYGAKFGFVKIGYGLKTKPEIIPEVQVIETVPTKAKPALKSTKGFSKPLEKAKKTYYTEQVKKGMSTIKVPFSEFERLIKPGTILKYGMYSAYAIRPAMMQKFKQEIDLGKIKIETQRQEQKITPTLRISQAQLPQIETIQLPKQKSEKAVMPTSKRELRTITEYERTYVPLITPPYTITTYFKKPTTIIPPIMFGVQKPVEAKYAYDTYINGRKATKKPTTRNVALGIGADITDKTPATSFTIKKTKGTPVKNPRYEMTWGSIGYKFSQKGNKYYEKKQYQKDYDIERGKYVKKPQKRASGTKSPFFSITPIGGRK